LAYAVASGEDLYAACRFANAAAALSIEQKGAQTGMPTLDEVNRMLAVSEKAESM
jgi:ribokinase